MPPSHATSGIGDFGGLCSNVLRLEKGFRLWGAEMNVDTDPIEAGLHAFINFDKVLLMLLFLDMSNLYQCVLLYNFYFCILKIIFF